MANIDAAVQEVGKLIDQLGDPKRGMSKQDWVEFLTGIMSDCESKREAAEEEIRAEGGGGS